MMPGPKKPWIFSCLRGQGGGAGGREWAGSARERAHGCLDDVCGAPGVPHLLRHLLLGAELQNLGSSSGGALGRLAAARSVWALPLIIPAPRPIAASGQALRLSLLSPTASTPTHPPLTSVYLPSSTSSRRPVRMGVSRRGMPPCCPNLQHTGDRIAPLSASASSPPLAPLPHPCPATREHPHSRAPEDARHRLIQVLLITVAEASHVLAHLQPRGAHAH